MVKCDCVCLYMYIYSRLQQEYQTFYHRSFRVSDYVNTDGDGSRMRQLVEACTGIEVSDCKFSMREGICCMVYLVY